MTNAKNMINVHRFRDELAIGVADYETGATVYVNLKQAKKLRTALNRIVRSIERESFGDSPNGMDCTLTVRDTRYSHGEKLSR